MGSVAHRRAHRTRGRPIMTSTIALVDDDQNILTSVNMALEAEGFDVRANKDGEDELRGLSQRPVDIAVPYINMPHSDGMDQPQRMSQTGQEHDHILNTRASDRQRGRHGKRVK